MLRVSKQKKGFLSLMLIGLVTMLMFSTMFVFADTKAEVAEAEGAKKQLTGYVYGKMQGESYEVDGGGSLSGKDLFSGSPADGYDLKEDEFNTLTSSAQTQVVSDIAENSNAAVKDDKAELVTESTVQNWWKELQMKKGVGSKFLSEILKNTKPDFVRANQIFRPFSGPIGTAIGVVTVLIMAFLGLVIAMDIAYMTIPPFRLFMADDDSEGRTPKSKIISFDAIYAVKSVEEGDGGNSKPRQVLWIYLGRKWLSIVILGICLLYLVQGRIYTFVGWVLDLVSGFL